MLTKIILTTPKRKNPRLHSGFELFINRSPRRMPIYNCCEGHWNAIRRGLGAGGDVLVFEDDVVPVEQWESRMEYGLMRIREECRPPDPFVFSLYATADLSLAWSGERPFTLPDKNIQDWGFQAMYYSREMIPIALELLGAFLRTPARRIPGWVRGFDGPDYFLYKACRLLRIPVYYWPLVQHDQRVKSVAECPSHRSPLLPEVNEGDDLVVAPQQGPPILQGGGKVGVTGGVSPDHRGRCDCPPPSSEKKAPLRG